MSLPGGAAFDDREMMLLQLLQDKARASFLPQWRRPLSATPVGLVLDFDRVDVSLHAFLDLLPALVGLPAEWSLPRPIFFPIFII